MKIRLFTATIAAVWSLSALGAGAGGWASPAGSVTGSTANDRRLIASAMQAAPRKVGRDAKIVMMDEGGAMLTLREGTNGFVCMPDNPGSPGRDPMCLDSNAMAWLHALMTNAVPDSGKAGLIYMLAGGSDASNTDPFSTQPSPGHDWITTGPHVMIVGADTSFYALYPNEPVPDTSVPYVMWGAGTDTRYQHLMIPVKQRGVLAPKP
ncbi:MAG: hypothetical protein U1E83_02205 [Methylotetracoccus sp.]